MKNDTNGKVKIYICSHKKFETYTPENTDHILLGQSKTIKSDTLAAKYVLDKFTKTHNVCYGELCNIHYLWQHQNILPEYVGICHYRRFFNEFVNDTSKIPELIEKHGCIVKTPLYTNASQEEILKREHSFTFPIMLKDIITKHFPDYLNAYNFTMKSNYIYNRNMFIIKKEDFIKYCEFIFGVLSKFDEMNNLTDNDTVTQFVFREFQMGHFRAGKTDIMWQNRLQGYLAERLTDVFIRKNFNENIIYKTPELFITEDNQKIVCIDK